MQKPLLLCATTLIALATGGHPSSSAGHDQQPQPQQPQALARHAAVFTTFCDTGSVADGNCYCKGGSATAAIGDGSWLWSELVGAPCAAQPDDRCDCSSCGGASSDCPHEGCWQCQGINAPQCNPSDELKRCEVEVHGTHGAEKFYLTEACPSAHPCNRCKEQRLQRCAAWSPLAVDLCGTTWSNVFERSRSEASGFVTLSCYPHAFAGLESGGTSSSASDGEHEGESYSAADDDDGENACASGMDGDVSTVSCEDWCSVASASDRKLQPPSYVLTRISLPSNGDTRIAVEPAAGLTVLCLLPRRCRRLPVVQVPRVRQHGERVR